MGFMATLGVLVQAQGVARTNAELSRLNKTSNRTADAMEAVASKFSNLDNNVGDFNRTMTATRNVVSIVKWPALIAGAGLAAQAIGALTAGAIGLASALGPTVGLAGAAAGAYAALAQGMGVAKLASMGMDKALEGISKKLEKPTPLAKRLAKVVKSDLLPEILHLRDVAQSRLFDGVGESIKRAGPLLRSFNGIVGDTAGALNRLGQQAFAMFGSALWQRDLHQAGENNVKVISRIGRAALYMAQVLRDLFMAAQPLTLWLAKMAEKYALVARNSTFAARENGTLADFFEKTRKVTHQLFVIFGNLAVGLFNIGKAAAPMGRDLLGLLVKLTSKFKDWTGSLAGQNALRSYFKAAKEPLLAIVGLVGDLGGALVRLSKPTGNTSPMIQQLRELVPVLENLIKGTTAALGPALIDAIINLARVLAVFIGSSGPLVILVRTISLFAGALADLLEHSAGLQQMGVFTLGLVGSMKVLSVLFGPLAKGILATATAYRALAAGTLATTVATETSIAATIAAKAVMLAQAAATKAAAAAQWLLNASLLGFPLIAIVAALVALGVAFYVAYKKSETFRNIVNTVLDALKSAGEWIMGAGVATWHALADAFQWVVNAAGNVVTAVTTAWDAVAGATATAWNVIKAVTTVVWGGIASYLGSAWSDIAAAWADVTKVILDAWKAVSHAVSVVAHAVWGAIAPYLEALWKGLSTVATMYFNLVKKVITTAWNAIRTATSAVWGAIKTALTTVWNAISAVAMAVFTRLSTGLLRIWGVIKQGLINIWNAIKSVATAVWDLIGGAIMTPIRKARDVLEGIWKTIKSVAKAAWDGIKSAIANAAGPILGVIVSPFKAAFKQVARFAHLILEVIDKIPGVNTEPAQAAIQRFIDGSQATSGAGSGAKSRAPGAAMAKGGAFARTGGVVNNPIVMMGEEAPRFPEYVIPTNPAYRGRAQGLLTQAAGAIGMTSGGVYSKQELAALWSRVNPGLGDPNLMAAIALAESGGRASIVNSIGAGGLWQINPPMANYLDPVQNARYAGMKLRTQGLGAWEAYTNGAYKQFLSKSFVGKVGDFVGGLNPLDLIKKLPGVDDLPDWLQGMGKFVLGKAGSFIKDQLATLITKSGAGNFGLAGTGGPTGLGTFDGKQVANWIIPILNWARSHGWGGSITSGYRSHAYNVAQGRNYVSNHEGTAYPGGAIDVGGYGARAEGQALASVLARYPKRPNLVWGGPVINDWGHFSASGHKTGGVYGKYLGAYEQGGTLPATGFYLGHKGETVIPAVGFKNGGVNQGTSVGTVNKGDPAIGVAGKSKGYLPPTLPPAATFAQAYAAIKAGNIKGVRKGLLAKIGNLALPKSLLDELGALENKQAIYADFANRAGTLTDTDAIQTTLNEEYLARAAMGKKFPAGDQLALVREMQAKVQGHSQFEWLGEQLEVLLRWRNRLIEIAEQARKEFDRIRGLMDKAKGRLVQVNSSIATATQIRQNKAEELKDLQKHKKNLQKHPKRNADLIDEINKRIERVKGRIAEIDEKQAERTRLRDALGGGNGIIAAFGASMDTWSTGRGEMLDTLSAVQGAGSSMDVMSTLPKLGDLGGTIFETQFARDQLGKSMSMMQAVTDTGAGAGLELPEDPQVTLARLAMQETRFKLYLGMLQRYGENMPFGGQPWLGSFKTGGILPADGVYYGHKGETVVPAEGNAGIGEMHIYLGDKEITDLVDMRIVMRDRDKHQAYRAGGKR